MKNSLFPDKYRAERNAIYDIFARTRATSSGPTFHELFLQHHGRARKSASVISEPSKNFAEAFLSDEFITVQVSSRKRGVRIQA